MPTPEELYGKGPTAYKTTGGGVTPEQLYAGESLQEREARLAQESDLGERMLAEAPQTVGGIAGGVAGATKGAAIGAPFGPVGIAAGGVIGGATGALVGGAAGKGYQQVYRHATGSEKAPQTSYDAAVEMAMAGGEEAAWDLGGQLVGRGLAKGFHYLRPKAVDDVEKLAVKLEKSGGQMTAAQRTDNWMIHQLDSLTRGSLTGSGRMQTIDVLNEAALKNIESELRQNIAKNVTQNLSDRELGELFLNTVRDGRAAFRTTVGELYGGLDDMVKVGVNTTKTKEALIPMREQLERVNWINESPESRKLLDSIMSLPDNLSFGDAQVLRSNLLDAQRNLETLAGKSKITSKVNQVVGDLTKAMDESALREGPQVAAKYKAIKDYANKGYKVFDSKFITDLVVADKKNPERIGEYLFRAGNVEEINKAKKALRYAAATAKDRGVNYDRVWGQMQQGYLNTILGRAERLGGIPAGVSAEEVAKSISDVSGAKLLKEFTDPKRSRTLDAVFNKEQKEAILEFAKVAERVQRRSEGGLGMVMQLVQGGAIAGAATGKIEAGEAASVFIPTWVMAKMMTNPKWAKRLATSLETPVGNGRASAALSQLASYAYDVQRED